MKRVYLFFGSANFAVILIFLAALLVAIGTYLESSTESHQAAADLIYKSVFFKLLLIGFFINIFVSAIRRWPFQWKHAPFLITHLGLLMVITGTFIKAVYGTQGNLILLEGGSGSQIQMPGTMMISAVDRSGNIMSLPLEKDLWGKHYLPYNPLCSLQELCPHSEEKLFAWIAGDKAYFYGHHPFPAHQWQPGQPLPKDNPLALITDFKQEAIQELLMQSLSLEISDIDKAKQLFPLSQGEANFNGWHIHVFLEDQSIKVTYANALRKGTIRIDLTGPLALFNQHESNAFLGQAPLSINLKSTMPFTILQDSQGKTTLAKSDPHGRLLLDNSASGSYLAYNSGFDGYAVQAEFAEGESRKEMEQEFRKEILKNLIQDSSNLLSFRPIKLFQEACESIQCQFPESFLSFLEEWHQKGGWLYPEDSALSENMAKIFRAFDWASLQPEEIKSSLWMGNFFKDFDKSLLHGESFMHILKERKWPLLSSLELLKNEEERLMLFSQQLFSLGNEVPWVSFSQEPEMIARIFTALLRNYGIHYSHIPYQPTGKSTTTSFESPILRKNIPLAPKPKLEDNLPLAIIKINNEPIALTYNSAMKWPTSDGSYLLKFQAQNEELPYSVRLHRAKQVNYPDSEQAFSYESELTFTDRRSGQEERKVISMNQVHETWDGYRFYLSGLSENASGAHLVQLVINRDPAKYWLTYPGGCLVALGIILLFWRHKRLPSNLELLKK